ncbi:hypothetical protein PN462_17475 [Spirulina sp. CS-785/01]|uniref:hypothetical protein n=1 Tax=Spirulina sp. CS-785/01 TaxID=3021716 RepID=UPI00232F6E49|nr:hypothetical protein [Spirulina sp. CS-785/01]MDB9314909.1 hypothetical protein [Spirulina sp. CS-785/01]
MESFIYQPQNQLDAVVNQAQTGTSTPQTATQSRTIGSRQEQTLTLAILHRVA